MKTRMRTRILALLLSMAMVMNGGISALASEAAPVANEETGHKHTAECYVEEKTVTCGLEQSEGHSHGEGCYTTTITCGQEEFEGHSHTDDCYTTTVSTCEKEEHTHGEGCNSEESPCGIEEHTHDDGCTTETTELTCGQEEVTGHTHDDSCKITELTCGQEEVTGHTHSDACYTTTSTLVCTIPETETEVNPITEDLEVCEVCGLEECACEKEEPAACEKCELSLEECTCEKKELAVCACGNEACECENCEESCTCTPVEEVCACGNEACECENCEEGCTCTPVEEVCACGNEACECENCEEGCTCTLVEEFVESVEFEDEDIKVTVTAVDENAIPADVTLCVVPITSLSKEYGEVEEQLFEEVDNEEQDLLGFVAYDITFVDIEGNEIEPAGQVLVSMEYKKAITPEATENVEEANVTVMHFEEDTETGEVTRIVDMGKEDLLNDINTTSENKVETAEFETKSFSVFTIIWTIDSTEMKVYCVDTSGVPITENEQVLRKQEITTATEIEDIVKDIVDHEFVRAYVAESSGSSFEDSDDDGVEDSVAEKIEGIYSIRYNNGQWEYSKYSCTEEHIHSEACVEKTSELSCGKTETEAHEHKKECRTLICKQEEHKHNACDLSCEEIEHTHEDSCYTKEYTCGKEETEGHVHSNESCYTDVVKFVPFEKNKLFFEYKINVAGKVARKATADVSGIKISLYNYTGKINTLQASKNSQFYFRTAGDGGFEAKSGTSPEGVYNVGGLAQNLVKYNLGSDKYPVLNPNFVVSGGNSNSLNYLFTANSGYVTVYDGVNGNGLTGLLQKDSKGYYHYDSKINHAQYNAETKNIDIYDGALGHVKRSNDATHKDYGGQFLPFDNINDATAKATMQVDGKEVELYKLSTGANSKTSEDNNQGDMWFGMTLDTAFMQPKNGQLNGEDVIFEFSGDDDVWVFIDGIKVLDLGGIHGAQYGNINFATGDVTINSAVSTTIYACYKAAYIEEKGYNANSLTDAQTKEINEYLDTIFVTRNEKKVFKDFDPHTMNFFYFERGEGLSNCRVKFNLPILPADQVIVKKEIENYDENVANDVEFSFKMYTKAEGASGYTLLTNHDYKFYEDGAENSTETRNTGADGIFKLKHNERAIFDDLIQGTDYYVEEVGVSGNEYSNVIIDASGVVDENGNIIAEDETKDIRSRELEVGTDPWVIFRNVCANFQYLVVEKNILEKDVKYANPNTKYTFDIKVAGEDYVGKYKVITKEKYEKNATDLNKLRIYLDGIAAQTTNGEDIKLGKDDVAIILGNAYEEGSSITGFPARTSFAVKEISLNEALYDVPLYEIVPETAEGLPVTQADDYDNYTAGKIVLDKNAHVKVTNALRYGELEIQKKLLTYNQSLGEASFVFRIELKDYTGTNTIFKDVVSLEFNDAGVKTYTYPMKFPAGYEVVVTEVYSGASYELKESNGTVNIVADTTGTVSFTNDYVDGRLNGGGSILNVFKKTDGTWSGTGYNDVLALPVTVKDDEEDSETIN